MNLAQIIPGKNYPTSVKVTEKDGTVVTFLLQSYYVGMYCAIYLNSRRISQTGDCDNKRFVANLKEDLEAAIARGDTVEIGSICNCQLEIPQ